MDEQCDLPGPLCVIGDTAGSIGSRIGESALGQLAEGVAEGVGTMVKTLASAWLLIPAPVVTTVDGSGPSDSVEFVSGSLFYVTGVLLVLSLVVGAVRMMLEHRAEPAKELVWALSRFTLVTTAGMFVLGLVVALVDLLSAAILDASTEGTSFEQNVGNMLMLLSATTGAPGSPGVVIQILLGLIAVIVSFTQIALMVLRYALLPLLAGVWPTFAAFSNTRQGRQGFDKITAWIVALAIYKLPVTVIYGLAFRMVGADVFAADGTGMLTVISGLILMVAAVAALPALVTLIAPAAAAFGTPMGGGSGAVQALGGALATGAIHAGRGRGEGSAGGVEPPRSAPTSNDGEGRPGGAIANPSNPQKASESGTSGAPTAAGPGGAPAGAPAAAGAAGAPAAASTAGGSAAGGAAAGGGTGAVAGPAGLAAGAVAGAGMQAADGARQRLTGDIEDAAGGPSGAAR